MKLPDMHVCTFGWVYARILRHKSLRLLQGTTIHPAYDGNPGLRRSCGQKPKRLGRDPRQRNRNLVTTVVKPRRLEQDIRFP